jgi:molybdenum cofactor cytidylyltransferase
VRVERITPGRRAPAKLAGSVLTRDLTVAGKRWSKGRRLSAEDLLALAAEETGPTVTVLVASGNELHEDEAALRLAKAIAGPGLDARGPNQSRLDLVASVDGVVTVRIAELDRINRLDPLEVFTVFDGQVVEKGDLVASVKVAPHLVDAGVIEAGGRIAGFGSQPVVSVAPFVARRVGVVV